MKLIKSSLLFLWYLLASAIILVAILGVLVNLLTPILNDHKDIVADRLSKLLHHELTLGSIDAHWARFGPVIEFHDVVVTENHHEFLRAKKLTAHLGLYRTLLRGKAYFQSLVLSGTTINLKQLSEQQFLLNDTETIRLNGGGENTELEHVDWLLWLIWQRQVTLNDVQVQYIPLEGKELAFNLADLELSKERDTQNIYTKVFFTDWQKQPVTASIQLKGSLSDYKHLVINGYLRGENLNLAKISEEIKLPFVINRGRAGVKIWFSAVNDHIQSLQSQLDIQQADFTRKSKTLSIQSLQGNLAWLPQDSGWMVLGDQFNIVAQGRHWDTTEFKYVREAKQSNLELSYIDLGSLTHELMLLGMLPDSLEDTLTHVNPQGAIKDVFVHIPADMNQIGGYKIAGNLDQVSFNSYKTIPGVSGVSGMLVGSAQSGQFDVGITDGQIDAGKFFDQPIDIATAKASGVWQHDQKNLEVRLGQLQVANKSIEANATMRLLVPDVIAGNKHKSSPWLSLLGEFNLTDSKSISNYLPVNLFNDAVKGWLNTAFVSGEGGKGVVLIRGDLSEFPFAQHSGTFIVDSKVNHLNLSFADDWPAIHDINADLLFDGSSMNAQVNDANTHSIQIHNAKVTIPDLTSSHVMLEVQGKTNEQAGDALSYIDDTPLKSSLGEWLAPFSVKGALSVGLNISVPLSDDVSNTKVKGEAVFNDNQIQINDWGVLLNQLKGTLAFDNDSISTSNIVAKLGDNPAHIKINTLKDTRSGNVINVLFDGKASAADIATAVGNPSLSQYLSGLTDYQGYALIPFDQAKSAFQLSLKSTLAGMQVQLPEPFAKPANEERLFVLDLSSKKDNLPVKININYGKDINSVMYYAAKTKDEPASLSITAKAPSLSWPIDLPKTSSNETSDWMGLMRHVTLNTSRFTFYGIPLTQFSMIMDSDISDNKTIKASSDQVKGQIRMPVNYQTAGIDADLEYLILSKGSKGLGESRQSISAKDISAIPPLDINIGRLTIDKKFFGKAQLKTSPISNGLNIDKLTTLSSLLTTHASGQWIMNNGKTTTHLKGEADTNNLGDLARSLSLSDKVQAKESQLIYDLSWPLAPYQLKFQQTNGTATMSISDGVIPVGSDSVTMGLGKVLSLFSVESIKRRLKLDFSDLSDDGYSYNDMVANVKVSNGNAYFSKSYFDGPQAKIEFSGRVGLDKKEYDNTLVVIPYVTSTIPIIATIAGGPIAGVAAYAVDKLVSSGVKDITGYTYYLRGTWENPELINANEETTTEVPVTTSEPVSNTRTVDGNNGRS